MFILISGFLWIMYFVITSVVLLPPIVYQVDNITKTLSNPSSIWIVRSIPLFLVFTVFLVIIGLGYLVVKQPWIRYNQNEKDFLKRERGKIGRVFKKGGLK
jgi:hypothetical protein